MRFLAASLFFVAACTATGDDPHGTRGTPQGLGQGTGDSDTTLPGDSNATACAPEHEACGTAGCCEGLWCNEFAGYGIPTCYAPLENGASCTSNGDCASGNCLEYICAAATCGATEALCVSDGDCCAGFCLYPTDAYGPGHCSGPLPDGEQCSYGTQCQSGWCIEYACSSECAPNDAFIECGAGGPPCCEGVCHDGGYGWGQCAAPYPNGEWCMYDQECASGVCTEYRCGCPESGCEL
jgi:hypothetical protein